MATEWLVDTNVLIDIIHEDPLFAEASTQALERCAEHGILVINPIIYGEVGAICDSLEELDSLLSLGLFRRDPLIWEASFLAGQAFRRYRKNGGQKQRVLANFLIGAHASVAGFGLISRDTGYLKYFKLELLNPAEV
ncbi:type II toxin-antitoxin system VapC family toxin [uncultured Thiothrix sp.]|uniref:type II toxin-antitoxin system VapC family toxin n=1 Tax=uncultured Thiothrix sp. TaxID=223185 RepID=UPI0026230408|nr:type II toxin-antitoxin system VapC family toxin [uncultured Thiothrix sp.]HMT93752.1 type II toxin-antitoxin system VapC family toxin [Thiolinea sp.]